VVCGRSPQKPDIHTQSAVDKHIFVMCSYKIHGLCYPHPTPQKTLRICANLTTHPGRGRVGTCHVPTHGARAPRVHPWLRQCKLGQPVRKVDFTALNRLTRLQRRTTDSMDQLNFRRLFRLNSTPTSNDRLDRSTRSISGSRADGAR